MPANVAKDAVSLGPKMVLLKARTSGHFSALSTSAVSRLLMRYEGSSRLTPVEARRTFKAVLSAPRLVPSLADAGADGGQLSDDYEDDGEVVPAKRKARQGGGKKKKVKTATSRSQAELVPTA